MLGTPPDRGAARDYHPWRGVPALVCLLLLSVLGASKCAEPPREKGTQSMTKLQRLYEEQGQSPWLDNLTRLYLQDGSHGTLARLVRQGIRGVTANPTIFAKAIEGSDAYDQQFTELIDDGCS